MPSNARLILGLVSLALLKKATCDQISFFCLGLAGPARDCSPLIPGFCESAGNFPVRSIFQGNPTTPCTQLPPGTQTQNCIQETAPGGGTGDLRFACAYGDVAKATFDAAPEPNYLIPEYGATFQDQIDSKEHPFPVRRPMRVFLWVRYHCLIGLAAVTLGTETDGSITCPTSNNNLAGIKPTVGLTSRAGVIPISTHQDTVGPMTRSLTDAAIILSVIAGKDPNDNDFKVQLNEYFAALLENPSGVRTLADLIKFDDDNPTLEEPAGFEDQSRFIQAEATNGFDAEYFAALTADHDLGSKQGINFVLKKFNLDALVLPAPGLTTSPAAVVGYPIVTGPLGFFPENVTIGSAGPETVYPAPGVPSGLSFLGTAFSDFELIGFGFAYEQKTQTRLARKAFPAAIPKTQLKDVLGK
ncbi:amidase signature domain-containing protein [Mycena leptocephala]|nr:amidase signature domain-containing protein [Mycena leptocephala]KAJ7914561.1 amidase signature domain-containing protein [Mycena leptocephala]